jgi:hypothetical protein
MLFVQGLKINGLQFRGNEVSMLIYNRFFHSKSEEDRERDWRGKQDSYGGWRGREEIQDSRIQD